MHVHEAVDSRRSVRDFDDRPVPRETLERVLTRAARAPSSGNLQPWRLHVVGGRPLAELKARAVRRAGEGDPGDARQYPRYPDPMSPVHHERFVGAATLRYAALGVERSDPDRPRRIATANATAFGAPVVLFCHLEPDVGPGQWADAGMYLQTVMLLLRAEGLHSCPQVMWTMFREDVRATVGVEADQVLPCGVAVGYERQGADTRRTDRAALSEVVTFHGL